MSRRSVAVGLILAAALCGWCYFSDHVIRAGELVGNMMPVVVFGGLVACLLALGALRLAGLKRLPSAAEITVVLALLLCVCGVPGRFTQCMPASILCPRHDYRLHPGWQQQGVLELVPSQLMPDPSGDEDRVLNGFITGLGQGDRRISFWDVPWRSWAKPLAFWVPLMLLLTASTLGLAAVYHRQWAHHEQLPYPIATFAHALIRDDDDNGGHLFANRLFWLGFLALLTIELNNYCCRWWPDVLIPVSLRFDFSPLASKLQTIVRGKGMGLFYPRIMPVVVGLAFLLASDVSLSMAAGPWIYCLFAGIALGYGVELRPGREMALSIETFLYSGGYFGIFLMLLYTGRHFYWNAFRRSVWASTREQIPDYTVGGMRIFLVCTAGSFVLLLFAGIPWFLAGLYLMFALMVYSVVSRIVAETGAFMVGTFVFPGVLLWGFFGATALGPRLMVTLFMLSTVVLLIPGRAPMAFISHAFRLADLSGNHVSGTVRWGLAVLVLGFAIAVPVSIYWQYDRGTPNYGWPRRAATYPFQNTVEAIHKLKAQGRYAESEKATGLERVRAFDPSGPHVAAFGAAAALAILFGAGRLKFRHWPLHPVVFLFLGGSAAISMSFSFFLGWLVKATASKYGGARMYRVLKP
ncbi:MAG: hypothetical protein KAI66_24710, partial [Lentisphaeria bacterium]|nr:hypothetical protein [Lentisphaeria bacterium]